jgi:integral membrane protein (TIGR01906 family)
VGSRLGGWLVAAAAAVVILGASIAPFLAPPVVRFEQDRTGVGGLTGYTPAELDGVTGALLGDLVFWRGDFDVAVDRAPVLGDTERAHMRDVRTVFTAFWVVVLVGAVGLLVAFRRSRGSLDARADTWRSVGRGARILAVAIAVAGALVLVAFDAVFEVFHRLFFSAGSYTFDPATAKLVQLFPEAFWSEIAVAVGVVVLGAAILTAFLAARRAASLAAWREQSVFAATRAGT